MRIARNPGLAGHIKKCLPLRAGCNDAFQHAGLPSISDLETHNIKKDCAVRNIEVTKVGFLVASEDDLRLRWYKLNGYPFEHVRLPL